MKENDALSTCDTFLSHCYTFAKKKGSRKPLFYKGFPTSVTVLHFFFLTLYEKK